MDPRPRSHVGMYYLHPSDSIRELMRVKDGPLGPTVGIRPSQSSVEAPFGPIGLFEPGFGRRVPAHFGDSLPESEYARSALAGLMDQDQPEFISQLPSKQDMTAQYGSPTAHDFGYTGEQVPKPPRSQSYNPGYRKWDNYNLPDMLGSPFASR